MKNNSMNACSRGICRRPAGKVGFEPTFSSAGALQDALRVEKIADAIRDCIRLYVHVGSKANVAGLAASTTAPCDFLIAFGRALSLLFWHFPGQMLASRGGAELTCCKTLRCS